jgi:hypothetical protein
MFNNGIAEQQPTVSLISYCLALPYTHQCTMGPFYKGHLGNRKTVCYTVEPLYKGHLGNRKTVCYTVEPLYKGHLGNRKTVCYTEVSPIQRLFYKHNNLSGQAQNLFCRGFHH